MLKALLLSTFLTGLGFAAVATLAQEDPAPATELDDLSWLAGTWIQASEGDDGIAGEWRWKRSP